MLYFYHVHCLPKATQFTPTKLHVVLLSQKKIINNEKWKTLWVVSSNEDRQGGGYSGPPGEEGKERSGGLPASSPSVTVAVGPWERAVLQVGWSLK